MNSTAAMSDIIFLKDIDEMPVITPEEIQRYADAQALAGGLQMSPERLARDLDIARRLQELQRKDPQLDEMMARLRKLQALFHRIEAQARRNDATLTKLKRGGELRKARRDDHEANRLRSTLRQAAALQKSAKWWELDWKDRRRITIAERDARQALLAIEKRQKARQSLEDAIDKNRQAMTERGVTFHTMACA